MAYNQPVRFFYDGDKVVAARYVREARRLIANMLALLPPTTPAGRRIFRYPEGVSIEIIIADQQVTTIIRTTPPVRKLQRLFDDFVVTPRSSVWPDGTDADHPQMILRAPQADGESWRTFFYDQTNPLYAGFAGPKGTYKNNPTGQPLFPDGIVHAGNVDWRGQNGERISWYGPDSRYLFDIYRQPSDQYGRFVFNLGQVLFDVDKYCIDNTVDWYARLVVGACLREHDDETWLYMMMAEMPDLSIPTRTVGPQEVYFSESYPMYDVDYRLRRVRLQRAPLTTKAMKWSAVDGSAEEVWSYSVARGCNPWVFSTDGTKMTTFALPISPVFLFNDNLSTELGNVPPAQQDRIDVDVSNPSAPNASTTHPSMAPGASSAVTAVDYTDGGDLIEVSLRRAPLSLSPHGLSLMMGSVAYPLWYSEPPAAGFTSRAVRRRIVWLDARAQFMVCEELLYNIGSGVYRFEYATVVMHRGEVVSRRVSTVDAGSGSAEDDAIGVLEGCKDVSVAPLAMLWMLRANIFSTTVRASIDGLMVAQMLQPFVPSATFGQFGARSNSVGPSTAVSSFARSGFSNSLTDIHGHRQSFGAAATEGKLLYSGWFDDGQVSVKNQSVAYATGGSLAALTGVGESNSRYHPIWLLGQPIGGDRPPIATP